jgi:hypothetical protein
MFRCSAAILLLVAGCAANESQYGAGPWAPIAYEGFAEDVNAIAGEDAIDCGFHNLLEQGPWKAEAARKSTLRCVQTAIERGEPFKYGTLRIPIDSLAFEVLARPRGGDYWLRTYDVMVDHTGTAQWTKQCKSVRLDMRHGWYEGLDCKELR